MHGDHLAFGGEVGSVAGSDGLDLKTHIIINYNQSIEFGVSFLAFALAAVIGLVVNDVLFDGRDLNLIGKHVLVHEHGGLVLRKVVLHGHLGRGHDARQRKRV